MSNEQWLKRLRFGDHHANKARATWETAPTMVNTFTTGHVLGLAQGGEHAVKALVYYANRQPGRHGLVGMWNALPVEPDIRQRFASFVHRCGAVPAQGPLPGNGGVPAAHEGEDRPRLVPVHPTGGRAD